MDDADLDRLLGPARARWDAILAYVRAERPKHAREWKNYGKKHGWQLKLSEAKRAIVYLVPEEGGFRATMALREPAVRALRDAGLPPDVVREIEGAKTYPEGRPARVVVRSDEDVETVKKLLALKLA